VEDARLRYDDAGRLRELEHPGVRRTSYVYDAAGRLMTRTAHTLGYPPATESFEYTDDAITIADGSEYWYRWRIEGGRFVSHEYVIGSRGTPPFATSRWLYENDVFVGVETVLCRRPPTDPSAVCEPSAPPERTAVTRDSRGRLRQWVGGSLTESFTYDARGRLTRIRGIDSATRFWTDHRIDYACPER